MTQPAHDRRRTPGASTGRRHRPSGWHEYSTLPRSRVPILLSVFWMLYAVVMTAFDVVRGVFRPRRRQTGLASVIPAPMAEGGRQSSRAAAPPRIEYTTRTPTPAA